MRGKVNRIAPEVALYRRPTSKMDARGMVLFPVGFSLQPVYPFSFWARTFPFSRPVTDFLSDWPPLFSGIDPAAKIFPDLTTKSELP